jgi:hypothetical protein
MKRPITLTIVGMAWFLIGLSGAISEAMQTHGLAIPGANFINILVGVGLLKGWRICRWYALFVCGLTFLFALPMTVWAVFNSNKIVFHFPEVLIDDRPHAIAPLFLVVLVMMSYVAIAAWMFWVLMRPDIRELFQRKTNSHTPSISI